MDHGAIWRNVMHDNKRVGAYAGIGTDRDGPQEDAIGTDQNVVSDRRVAFPFMLAGPPQRDVMEHHAVFPDLRRFPDNDTDAVINKKSFAYFRRRMNLNPGPNLCAGYQHARKKRDSETVQSMSDAINKNGMERRMAQKSFDDAVRRRVIFLHGPNVLQDGLYHA
jgi:hypothetical protein